MPTLEAAGVNLYYEVYGDGPSILGIHRTPSSALLWVDAARELATRGSCVIYDRRGFGRSGRPDAPSAMGLHENVDDAVALLTALGAAPAAVIGRSTGGLIALALAHLHPESVRALVLLEAAFFSVDQGAAAWARALRGTVLEAAQSEPEAASEAVIRAALGDDTWSGLPDDLRELFTAASPAVVAEMHASGLDLSDDPLALSAQELTAIACPTLLVSSEQGPEACWLVNDRLQQALPHAETVMVSGGHLVHPAHPLVLEFLDRVLAP